MTKHEISYAPDLDTSGLADLYLPEPQPATPKLALMIHGGGWHTMTKESILFAVEPLVKVGWAVLAPSYRLIDRAPWPACGEDCLRATRSLLAAEHPLLAPPRQTAVLVAGASAGGHLALMTGLRLPREQVLGIVSMAGPSVLGRLRVNKGEGPFSDAFWRRFFGPEVVLDAKSFDAASPINHIGQSPPPLLCIQSTNDELVPPEHSELIVAAWQAAGGEAELYAFDGEPPSHGFCLTSEEPRELMPGPAQALTDFANRIQLT